MPGMNAFPLLLLSALGSAWISRGQALPGSTPNPLIDPAEFQRIVNESADAREHGRLDEHAFLQAMREPGMVLLDARSAANFKLRHIRGAVNLPFTEFTEETLARVIPTKDTRVLIYCNNNFLGSPAAFASKRPAASLNLSTQASLRAYGYHRIHELAPLLDVHNTRLPFEGTEVVAESPDPSTQTP